jgi:hypothetical protein
MGATDLMGPLMPIFVASTFVASTVLWLSLAVAVGLVAERRGSSGALWFTLAVFTSPVVALILLLILTPDGGVGPRA